MQPGAILVNTARGAHRRRDGDGRGAGSPASSAMPALDVFVEEPLPAGHPLTRLPNVTLSAHAAFRTPEASDNLIGAALDHCRRIVQEGK